ncbi:uncharacterized protein [Coffea arabica]|uniref:ATP-dependent DNA helicase n=1 Tax=Coffea arabica TaxID=13443 RepID=A0ABM4V394_COFAR
MESDVPFGGKTIIFGGDFRQTLPVIEQLGESDSIKSTVLCSYLWSHMCKQRLATNMRIALDPEFSAFFIRVGEDVEPVDDYGQMSLHLIWLFLIITKKSRLTDGLCNGTRLICRELDELTITAKSLGQTLDYIEIYLSEPVFSHGQFYVALSRVRNSSAVKALIAPDTFDDIKVDCKTRNVVFHDIFCLTNT